MSLIAGNSGFSFPDINVPEKSKDSEWHKQFVYAILNRSLTGSYDMEYSSIETCQEYYQGMQDARALDFVQENADGSALPAFWMNYQKIRPKIDLLTGEIIKKGWSIGVKSIDKESKSRKLEKREEAKVDFKLQPYARGLESQFGIPLSNKNTQFESEEQIDDHFDYDYKEKSEVVMKRALDYSLEMQRWDYERIALFRDITITGRAFVKCELENGIPKARRIDPKFMIFDKDSTDDFLSDATYFGEVRYMSIAECAQKYDITKKELIAAYNSQKSIGRNRDRDNRNYDFMSILDGTSMNFFSDRNGELRVMVAEAYWVDYKRLNNKISEDKYGNVHVKTLSDDTNRKKNVLSNWYKIWRKAVLIGGEIVKDYGEIKNMPRSIDDPADTGCPYKAVIPNYINYTVSSIVDRLKPLQDLKNIAMYNLQLAMNRAGAKGFVYDVSQTPEGWSPEEVMKYLKIAGIAFINSAQNDMPSQFNQFQRIDMSLGEEVNKYLEISAMCDREMDAITGINEARQGMVQSSSQAVGVTQSALIQSSLTTEVYFELFRYFCSDIFNYLAGLVKVSWPQYEDRFSPIIGDSGVNFLVNDIDLDLQDYGVFIEEIPESIADGTNLKEIVGLAVQNQSISLVSALKILKEKDIDRSIRMLEAELAKNEREQKKAEMAAMQQQQQAQQAQMQADQQKQQADLQGQMAITNLEGQNKLKEVSAKNKGTLLQENMKQRGNKETTLLNNKLTKNQQNEKKDKK